MSPFRVSAINIYEIDLPFTQTVARDQHCVLLIAFPNENILLNSDTSHLDLDHQSVFVSSDSAVFDKVSTAIRNYSGHAQQAIKISRILSRSATALNNYIPAFNGYLKRRRI